MSYWEGVACESAGFTCEVKDLQLMALIRGGGNFQRQAQLDEVCPWWPSFVPMAYSGTLPHLVPCLVCHEVSCFAGRTPHPDTLPCSSGSEQDV